MQLRRWQQSCLEEAIDHFKTGDHQFGCLATPGAGKTVFAAVTVKTLFDLKMVDYVVCVAPSLSVKEGLKTTFEQVLSRPMDGMFNAAGVCLTYQSLAALDATLIVRLRQYRLAVVVDEIHHCGGLEKTHATAWASPLLALTQQSDKAYTLSLSGTPWRTDGLPVTTLQYDELLLPKMHYCYGLSEAITDGVCRTPIIMAVDNEQWTIREDKKENTTHGSLASLLQHDGLLYQMVLDNPHFVDHMLSLSVATLDKRRETLPDAGGLIIASSIAHAKHIQAVLIELTHETPLLITSEEPDSQEKLKTYKYTNQKWLIAVGMVTEGTDIPRLQVCCHLSRICTELHFRQVLGRVLRHRGKRDADSAVLIMPAQPDLLAYANRLKEDVPQAVIMAGVPEVLEPLTTSIETYNEQPFSVEAEAPNIPSEIALLATEQQDHASGCSLSDAISQRVLFLSAYGKYKEEVLRYY
ncbi:DEAD/DEAH box helicase [Aliiglaciecola aliphaticivorans]